MRKNEGTKVDRTIRTIRKHDSFLGRNNIPFLLERHQHFSYHVVTQKPQR